MCGNFEFNVLIRIEAAHGLRTFVLGVTLQGPSLATEGWRTDNFYQEGYCIDCLACRPQSRQVLGCFLEWTTHSLVIAGMDD